jgi:hypothetical protein
VGGARPPQHRSLLTRLVSDTSVQERHTHAVARFQFRGQERSLLMTCDLESFTAPFASK